MRVWVDAWQLQCCGPPFGRGARVEWTLSDEPDREWLASVLGPDEAGRITHTEEHHGAVPDDAPVTVARVRRVRAVSCRFGPDQKARSGGERVLYPIPGTVHVVDVDSADGWYPVSDDFQFNGYLVDLEPVAGECSAYGS